MTGPFQRAAVQLTRTADDLEAQVPRLRVTADSYREVMGRLANLYQGTVAGDHAQRQAQALHQQAVTLMAGTTQLAQTLRDAAERARQGRS